MQDDEIEHRNWRIKEYLEDTPKALHTEKDILVIQIIQAMETDADMAISIDIDSLYDLGIDEVIRYLEKEVDSMKSRTLKLETSESFWCED